MNRLLRTLTRSSSSRVRGLILAAVVAVLATSMSLDAGTTADQLLRPQLIAAGGGAPAGRTLHFSGVLTDPATGNPLSGAFTMVFAILDAQTGGTAKWTETHPNSQVRKGVFNVQLGSVTDFPPDLYDTSPLYIEVTINPPSTPLSPRVLIARTGNAFHADKADDVKNDAITKDKIRDKAVERQKIQDKAIDKGKLEDKAVGKEKLEDKAVGKDQLDAEAVEKDKIKDGAVGNSKIEKGAVDKDKLGDDVKDLMRAQPGARAPFAVTKLGGFGQQQADVAVGVDGLPLVAYVFQGKLHAVHCEDPACKTFIDTPIADASGAPPAVVIGADGLPVLVHGGQSVRCTNTACTQAANPVVFAGSNFPRAILTAAGVPLVITERGVQTCTDPMCSSWAERGDLPGGFQSLAMGIDGRPLFATASGSNVLLSRCADPGCSGLDRQFATLSGNGTGQGVALTVGPDGNPVVGIVGGSSLRIIHCSDPGCTTTGPAVDVPNTDPGFVTGAVGADGRPLFALVSHIGVLTVVRCGNDACTHPSATQVLPFPSPTGGSFGANRDIAPAVTIGTDGHPVIVASTISNIGERSASLIHCTNRTCVPFFRER